MAKIRDLILTPHDAAAFGRQTNARLAALESGDQARRSQERAMRRPYGNGLPADGEDGDMLIKDAASQGGAKWGAGAIPQAGYGGMVLRRKEDGSGAVWGADLLGLEPLVEVYLGGDAEYYATVGRVTFYDQITANGWGLSDELTYDEKWSIAQGMMMPPYISDDGTSVTLWRSGYRMSEESFGFDDWQNSAPTRYIIYVKPNVADQTFFIDLPLNLWRNTGYGSPWSHIDLFVINAGNNGLRARVVLNNFGAVYEGTQVSPGEPSVDDHVDSRELYLEDQEHINWRIENAGGEMYGDTASIVRVVNDFIADRSGWPVRGGTGDKWWERYVKARRLVLPFSWMGTLAATGGERVFVNYERQYRAIGLVAATLDTPSSSGDVQIDIKVDGVSVLDAPLTIPEGEKRGTAEPGIHRWPLISTDSGGNPGGYQDWTVTPVRQIHLAAWPVDSEITAHIVDPGTGAANLTVQVYYG